MNLPSLRQLQYFIAVAEQHHFGRAAEHCFVTQSTLSAGIQELESLLGTTLFERSRRQVMLTPKGEALLPRARNILALSREMVEQAASGSTPLSGHLRLGVIPTIGPYLLPRVLPVIRQRYPELELQLAEGQSAHLMEQLAEGVLDCAIIAFPYDTGQFERRIFWAEDFLIAMPRSHPLAGAPALEAATLPRDELLLLEEGHCLTDHALSVCHLEGLQHRKAFQGTSLYTLLQMVAGGQGLTFVPRMAVSDELIRSSEITLVEMAEGGAHREIGLVWRRSYYAQDDLYLLADELRQILEN